ncbi:MAG: proteasome subunit alpha, partial [Candidatus Diapherotrites archaeon]|nr:proteasome subunit alpha [Candidatus Diapherotrites archaeon]
MYGAPGMGGYDRALTIFSPQGNLFQVEYAQEAVKKGGLAVAIKYKDGILFGTQKKHLSKLLVQESLDKIFRLEDSSVFMFSGMAGDARRLITAARETAEENRTVYGEEIDVRKLTKNIADMIQFYTQYGAVRPYGVT